MSDRSHMLVQYCGGCHNDKAKTGGMSVTGLHADDVGLQNAVWEKILEKVSTGQMPPKNMPRPSTGELTNFSAWLEASLDNYAKVHPNPGHNSLRRMNRAEYANAVHDILNLDVELGNELPIDDSGYGFDNIADALTFSPQLMQRYLAVAGKVARLATGEASRKPGVTIYQVPREGAKDLMGKPSYNERSSSDLPLDSRGGGAMNYYAPYDGTYTISVYLNANDFSENDLLKENKYDAKVRLKAGAHKLGVSFEKLLTLSEVVDRHYTVPGAGSAQLTYVIPAPPKSLHMSFDVDGKDVQTISVPSYDDSPMYSQSRFLRDALQMQVTGPEEITGAGDTPSRRRIFLCKPGPAEASQAACARKIFSSLVTHAYRRPAMDADIAPLMKRYDAARTDGFEHGIEAGLEAILVSPHFLFINDLDQKPPQAGSANIAPVSDRELASRLSFFLWSSVPDQELVKLAEQGRLRNKAVLERQVTRMLADPRSKALTDNFAGQWLYLRSLDYHFPNQEMFKDFDIRLRAAMRTETEMYFASVVHDNRPITDFIKSDYTFLNQRLAEHYGIPGVNGTAFRRVKLDPAWHRGGLLSQASILMATSADNRTSIVRRGKWILENLLAAPPPAPPPNVPALAEVPAGKALSVREQMEQHRANPVCASCHLRMDPLGFALETYDAVGAWRSQEAGKPVDASATLPDGTTFSGPTGLEDYLLKHKTQFVEAFTQRLMTYALARGIESYDMPTVRDIRRKTAGDGYRFKSIVTAIVESVPFQMKSVSVPVRSAANVDSPK